MKGDERQTQEGRKENHQGDSKVPVTSINTQNITDDATGLSEG